MHLRAADVIWTLGNWRVAYTGATVLLYVDQFLVSSRQVLGRFEADTMAESWRRSVLDVIELEHQAEGLKERS